MKQIKEVLEECLKLIPQESISEITHNGFKISLLEEDFIYKITRSWKTPIKVGELSSMPLWDIVITGDGIRPLTLAVKFRLVTDQQDSKKIAAWIISHIQGENWNDEEMADRNSRMFQNMEIIINTVKASLPNMKDDGWEMIWDNECIMNYPIQYTIDTVSEKSVVDVRTIDVWLPEFSDFTQENVTHLQKICVFQVRSDEKKRYMIMDTMGMVKSSVIEYEKTSDIVDIIKKNIASEIVSFLDSKKELHINDENVNLLNKFFEDL